jgi:uncharacterized protein (TIGR02145 family)
MPDTGSITVWVKVINDNGCINSVSTTIEVATAPTVSLLSGNPAQTAAKNTAITDILYTAANASDVTASGLPAGVSGLWNANTYTISGTPTEIGTFSCTITAAHTNGCTATDTYTLVVIEGINQLQGSCAFMQPPVVRTFASFDKNYSGGTYVTLTDERDNKNYTVVKIAGRWVMAQNLNYQKDLTWQANSADPSTGSGSNPALIGHFWCPGGYSSTTGISTLESCDVWGALYSWETAMSLDGLGSWSSDAITSYCTGAANSDNCKLNWGRTASGSGSGGRGICPPNWHVPTDFEWGVILDGMESSGGTTHQTTSISNTGVGTDAGKRGKSSCTCPTNVSSGSSCVDDTQANWYYHTNSGTDNYGFRILPAGYRANNGLDFNVRGHYAYFWSSSANSSADARYRLFDYSNTSVFWRNTSRSVGFSVRCIHD